MSYTNVEDKPDDRRDLNSRLEKLVGVLRATNDKFDSIERNILTQKPQAVEPTNAVRASDETMVDRIATMEHLASQLDQRVGEVIEEMG